MRFEFVAVVAGIAMTAAWELLVGAVVVGDWSLRPGFPGLAILAAIALPATWARSDSVCWLAWLTAAAAALSDAPSAAVRSTDLAGRFGEVLGGGGLALAVLGGLLAGSHAGRRLTPRAGQEWCVLALSLVAIAAYQGANRLMVAQGITNAERSLFVTGIEVHHLNWGIAIAIAAVFLLRRAKRNGVQWGLLCLLGFGAGTIWDQWLFYATRSLADPDYFSAPMSISGVLGCVLALIVARLLRPAEAQGMLA